MGAVHGQRLSRHHGRWTLAVNHGGRHRPDVGWPCAAHNGKLKVHGCETLTEVMHVQTSGRESREGYECRYGKCTQHVLCLSHIVVDMWNIAHQIDFTVTMPPAKALQRCSIMMCMLH